jgi:DNA (cytosine-5)-methyltransferase 1
VFADAIDALRPQYVVIENVRGLLSAAAHRSGEQSDECGDMEPLAPVMGNGTGRPVLRAAGAVLGDLADLGYDAVWATVAAADVGAPHRRERVFIVATADTASFRRDGWQDIPPRREEGERAQREPVGSVSEHAVATDATVGGWDSRVTESEGQLLPTPCVVDRLATGEMTLEEWDESRRSQKERGVGSFGPRGDSLGAAILRVEEGTERPDYSTTKARRGGDEPGVALLPTPTTQDGAKNGGPSQFQRNTLPLNAEVTLLPTPSLSDNKTPRRGAQLADTINNNTHTINLSDAVEYQHGRDALLCTPQASGESAWGKYSPAIARWEQIVGPAPAPTEPNKNGNPRLSAAFSEWLMGWPAGWVTDPAIGISRNDQLRIVGNGVCTQQAIAALRYLLGVTTDTHTHTHRERADVNALLPTPRASDPSNATSHSSPGFRPQLGEVVRKLAPNINAATE